MSTKAEPISAGYRVSLMPPLPEDDGPLWYWRAYGPDGTLEGHCSGTRREATCAAQKAMRVCGG